MCDSKLFKISVKLDARSEHWILGASGEVTIVFVTRLMLSLLIKLQALSLWGVFIDASLCVEALMVV